MIFLCISLDFVRARERVWLTTPKASNSCAGRGSLIEEEGVFKAFK